MKKTWPGIHTILKALVEVLVPRHEKFTPMENDVTVFVESYINHFPAQARYPLIFGIYFLQAAPILFLRSLRPFSRMSPADRWAFVEYMSASDWVIKRDLIRGIWTLCNIGVYSRPDVMLHIGYDVDRHFRERL